MIDLFVYSFLAQHLQGSGIMWKSYSFPVFLLTESSTKTLQEVLLSIFMFLHSQDTIGGLLHFEIVVRDVETSSGNARFSFK